MNVTLQQNATSDFGSAFVSPSFDETDGFVTPESMPPLMVLSLTSTEPMEITVTKTLVNGTYGMLFFKRENGVSIAFN